MSQPMSQHVAINTDRVQRHFEVLSSKSTAMQQMLKDCKSQIQDIAGILADAEENEGVDEMRKIYKSLLCLEDDVACHKVALTKVGREYEASMEKTDFKMHLEKKAKLESERKRYDPEGSEELSKFDEDVGRQAPAGAAEDADVVVEDNGGLMNDLCPLSKKPVMDLEDPVQDSKGYIYHRKAVTDYIKTSGRRGQPVRCPVAGTGHYINLNELKQAAAILRAKRRALFTGAQGPTQAAPGRHADVLDASSDED